MLTLNIYPKNKEHFVQLMDFCKTVLQICDSLNIEPVLSASLAVFAYTQDQTIEVHDVDLACSESDFPRLAEALEAQGVTTKFTDWHVLQARKDDLKIEFDAQEYWMRDLLEGTNVLKIKGLEMRIVSVAGLKELYRRGLQDTAVKEDVINRAKYDSIRKKLALLNALNQ